MKKSKYTALVASVLAGASMCSPTVFAKTTQAQAPVTQASAIQQLISVFNTIPSWPKNLVTLDATTQTYSWNNSKNAIPSSQWVGLACVFPGSTPDQYPSLLGMTTTTPNSPVTAGQLAKWIVQWEQIARRVDLSQEPTSDPFELLKLFQFFWGTHITGPNSIVSQQDMMAIRNNIVEVSRGWRILGRNKVQFLEPLNQVLSIKTQIAPLVAGHVYKPSDWNAVYGNVVKAFDSLTFSVQPNGNVVMTYDKSTGYNPGIGGHFVDSKGIMYSSYSWSIKHYMSATAVNEPSPEVFSPKEHTCHFKYNSYNQIGMDLPPSKGYTFYFDGSVINKVAAERGLSLVDDLPYAIGFHNGVIDWVKRIGPASLNYPSEVVCS